MDIILWQEYLKRSELCQLDYAVKMKWNQLFLNNFGSLNANPAPNIYHCVNIFQSCPFHSCQFFAFCEKKTVIQNWTHLFLKKKLKIGSAVSEISLINLCKSHKKRFFEKKFFNFLKNLKIPKTSENIDSIAATQKFFFSNQAHMTRC